MTLITSAGFWALDDCSHSLLHALYVPGLRSMSTSAAFSILRLATLTGFHYESGTEVP